jgi:hypothetical protein
MSDENDYVQHIKSGRPVPGTKILERRTKGLSLIRREFLGRLKLYTGYRPDSSLAIRWRGVGEFANARTVVDAIYELRLRGGPNGCSAQFPDLWVICYPDDPEIKGKVEEELGRMCQAVIDGYAR